MLSVSLLLVSFTGYFLLMYILFKGKKTALYPSLLVSGIVTASFVAGLAGCLQSVYGFIHIAGFVLLPLCIAHLVKRRADYPRPGLRDLFPFAVLIAGAFILYFIFRDRFLYATDDLAHWGRAVRSIVTNLRLPVEADEFTHGAYPPGSAMFIAFVSTVTGASDGVWYFAHGLMLLSFLVALLSAGKNVLVQVVLACFIPLFMNYVDPLESLYVDTMLGASAFACVALWLQDEERSPWGIVALALLLCPLVLIKNAGVFLAAMIALWAVVGYIRTHRAFSWKLLSLALPFLLLAAWFIYFGQHFEQLQKHQMSLAYYRQVLGEKSGKDIRQFFEIVLPHLFSLRENHALTIIPGYVLVLVAMLRQGKLRAWRHVFILAGVVALVYEIGIVLMYILSMPTNEIIAQNGLDFTHYNCALTIALQALLLYLCCQLDWPGLKAEKLGCLAVAGVALLVCAGVAFMQVDQRRPLHSKQYRIDNYATAYHASLMGDEISKLPRDASYIILFGELERWEGYSRNLTKYYLGGADVTRCFEQQEALTQRSREPWKYYIDLAAGEVELPTETVNVEHFTRTADKSFTNLLDTAGYKQNTRYSVTAKEDQVAARWDITGYLPINPGDVIRLQDVTWYPSDEDESRGGLYWFFADKSMRSAQIVAMEKDLADWAPVYDGYGRIVQITVPGNIGTTTAYLRIVCQNINENSVITINEEIK